MNWQEAHHRLLASLQAEVRRHWGRIGEIEKLLGVSDGYLNRLCSGKVEFKLGTFFRALDVLGVDPASFLAQALDIRVGPEEVLRQLECRRARDRRWQKIARATAALEASEPPPAPRGAVADAAGSLVGLLAGLDRREQLRRLQQAERYRSHAFAAAYLDHLDALRYDDSEAAAKLVTAVAVHLIPALPGPQGERIRLQCRALGVFGSARRSKGRYGTAASALRMALEVARRSASHEETANLLIRAAYLLKDHGQFERATALLNEALVIFVQLGSQWGIGRVLVDQGMILTALGKYEAAVLNLRQALRTLAGSASPIQRYHLAAYQFLAYAFENLGELDAAEQCLAEGVKAFESSHAVDQAKLLWSQGTLAFRRGDYLGSEEKLRVVGKVLGTIENPGQEALVALDLAAALLAQNKNEEAIRLAKSMTPLLMRFENNRIAEAGVLEFISSALEGRLNQGVVGEVRAKLRAGRTREPDAPLPLSRRARSRVPDRAV